MDIHGCKVKQLHKKKLLKNFINAKKLSKARQMMRLLSAKVKEPEEAKNLCRLDSTTM